MKILLIIKSTHQQNTLKVAEAMSEVAPLTVVELENAKNYNLSEYDIVGFGSGIYYGKHDKELIKFVEGLTDTPTYSFVISTSGTNNYKKYSKTLVSLLESKNKTVLGAFGCKGLDKFFIFKLFGGLNKDNPNEADFDAAQQFIIEIIEKYEQLKAKNDG